MFCTSGTQERAWADADEPIDMTASVRHTIDLAARNRERCFSRCILMTSAKKVVDPYDTAAAERAIAPRVKNKKARFDYQSGLVLNAGLAF
jgi:hypothetical protein